MNLFYMAAAFAIYSSISWTEIIQTEFFTIHHALNTDDEVRFANSIVTNLDPFVHHWLRHGLVLACPRLDIYVQPSDFVTAKDALQRLVGEQFFTDLDDLEQSLTKTEEEIVHIVRAFFIKYPMFFKEKHLRRASSSMVGPLVRHFKSLINDNAARLRLYDDNTRYLPLQAYDPNSYNVVILGGSTNLNQTEHPYLTLDTVFYEIAHWFVYETAANLIGNPKPAFCNMFNEFMADIMCAIYLDDPCRLKDANGVCTRNLNMHHKPLNELLWSTSPLSSHSRNEPIAHFFWEYYQKNGLELSSLQLISAFRFAQREYPFFGREFSRNQLWRDYFLEISLGYKNDFEFASRFLHFICENENSNEVGGPCSSVLDYLGDATTDFLRTDRIYKNSPTVIGNTWRQTTINDIPAAIHFSNTDGGQDMIKAHLRIDGVESEYIFLCMTTIERRMQLSFSSVDDTFKELTWDEMGTLRQTNRPQNGL